MNERAAPIATPPRAVLFDFDGVLADTANAHIAAWQRTFRRIGLEIAEASCARAVEEDDSSFFQSVLAEREVESTDLEGWLRWKRDLTLAMLAQGDWLFTGVKELVHALHAQGIQLGIVTGTTRANVETVLRRADLLACFAVIVSKEDVMSPKPSADGYSRAMEQLGFPVGSIVALEDSSRGIQAACAAGLRVIAVGHRLAEGEWTKGFPYVPGFRALRQTLQVMGVA